MPKSTQTSETLFLTEKVAELEKRLEVLEQYLLETDDDSGSIDLVSEQYRYRDAPRIKAFHKPVASTRGRRPRISSEDFRQRRDDLFMFLEVRWSDLEKPMATPRSLNQLLRAIQMASPGANSTWQYAQLTEHIATLWEFLQSGRYSGQPLQIANAIAGLPEISWRTSLDLGIKHLPANKC